MVLQWEHLYVYWLYTYEQDCCLCLEFVEDVDLLITRAERCLEAGAVMRTIDSDDVCKHAGPMHADIIAKVIGHLCAEKTVFEASNPRTSERFIKQYGLLQEKLYGVEWTFKIDHEVLIFSHCTIKF